MAVYDMFKASCPHCGAPVFDIVCPYCGSELVHPSANGIIENRQSGYKGLSYYDNAVKRFSVSSESHDPVLRGINRCADDILSDYSKRSSAVYDFMEKYKIGHNSYGKVMDKASEEKRVITHRLFGHHFIYDFPINDLNQAVPFLEHLLSDYFTKMGLPIIPGEWLEDAGMLKCCDSLTHNWNFVNGFDVLAGTVSLINGIQSFSLCFSPEVEERSIEMLAAQIGIGAFELLITASTYNPFLLVGALLSISSGVAGLIKKASRMFLEYHNGKLVIRFPENIFLT